MSLKQTNNLDNSTSKLGLFLSQNHLPQCHLQDERLSLYQSIQRSYLLSHQHHLWECRVLKYNNPQLSSNSHLQLQYRALEEHLAWEQQLQQVVAWLQQLQEHQQALMPSSEHPSNVTPIHHPQEDPLVGVVEVVEDQDPLLVHHNLLQANPVQEDKHQWQYLEMLKQWGDSQRHSMETNSEQTISLKKSKDSSGSTKTLQDTIHPSKKSPLLSPSYTDLRLQDGNGT